MFINDELVFSKQDLGRHAEEGEVRALIEQKLEAAARDRWRLGWY